MSALSSPASLHDAQSSTAWVRTVATGDLDELVQAQHDWSLRYDQLSRGVFAGRVTHIQLPGLRLVLEGANCALHQRGEIGRGQIGFAMPVDLPGAAHFNGQQLAADSMMTGRSEDLDLATPAGFSMIAAVVDRDLLAALWQSLYQKPLAAWLEHQLVVQARPAAADALRTAHLGLLTRLLDSPALLDDSLTVRRLRDELLVEWVEAIPARVDLAGLRTTAARKRVVDRACEVMLSQPELPPSILQVCHTIGASPRKLEYCFRDVLGTTPLQYLRAVRLNGVRRDLKRNADPAVGVQDVAARWGFWHMSDLSADYKRQFGELPSQTLRRPGSVSRR